MRIHGYDIDERVAELVAVLNEFPGIQTFSSCGGHKNPTAGQNPFGRFSVDFFIEPTEESLLSLARINKVVRDYFGRSADVKVGDVGGIEDDDEPCLCFSLCGRANPKELALFVREKGLKYLALMA